MRAAGVRVELAHELVRRRVAVLDERDRARERARVAGADAVDERARSSSRRRVMRRAAYARRLVRDAAQQQPGDDRRRCTIATAAIAYVQRAPIAFVSGPGDDERERRARRSSTLISSVNARPRTRSWAPRWTSVMLATTAPPFPKPASDHRGRADPDVRARRPRRRCRARRGRGSATYAAPRSRSISDAAREAAERRARCRSRPRAGRSRSRRRRTTAWRGRPRRRSRAPVATITIDHAISTHSSARERRTTRVALGQLAPVAAADRAVALEQPPPGSGRRAAPRSRT